jgi:hypothetical protein
MKQLSTIFCLCLTVLLGSAHASGQGHSYTLDDLLVGLRQNKERIKSIKASYVLVTATNSQEQELQGNSGYTGAPTSHPIPSSTRQHIVWIYKDGKYFCTEEVNEVNERGEPIHRSTPKYESTEWDGKTGHTIAYEPTKLSKKSVRDLVDVHDRENIFIPSPLLYGYRPSLGWVVDAIQDGHFALIGLTRSNDMGTLCTVEGFDKLGEPTQFVIAPERGYLAVQLTRKVNDKITLVDSCTRLALVDGFWFATDGKSETLDAKGKPNGGTIDWMEGAQIEVNKVDDSVFDIPHPPGSVIVDHDNHIMYEIGAHGERIGDQLIDGRETGLKGAVTGLRVYSVRWLFILSATSLFLLAAFAIIRRMQRKATT